jgi:hypothetical protein
MVNISTILKEIPYVRGKTDDEISAAVAAARQPDPEKVKIVTGFINNLINLEISKLEKDASNPYDAKAQQKAQQSRIKYHTNSPVALVNEVADTLTKNIFIVQELVGRDCLGYTDFNKTYAEGLNNIEQSTEVLLHSAIDIVNSKLSGYSMKIDTNNLQQSAKALVQELRNPPKPKSQTTITGGEANSPTETAAKTGTSITETPPATGTVNTTTETTKSSETPADHEKISTAFTKLITEISNLSSVKTLLQQDNGLETLSKLNQDLANLNPIIKDKNALQAPLAQALQALDENTHSENKTFINNYLANPEKFKEEFAKLSDDHKLQIQMTLINIEGQAKQTKTINNIASSIAEIKSGLGNDRLDTLLDNLKTINEQTSSENQENHLDTINTLLNEFNETLKTANQAGTGEEKIEERNKATEAFIEKLNTGLTNGSLSNADIELIQKYLDPKNTENQEQSQKSITEQVFKNSIKNVNISEEQLKSFGGLAIAAVVGLMVFCPNAIGNLVKSGTGLATMAAQTLPMFFQAQAMMQMSKKGNTETASSQAA